MSARKRPCPAPPPARFLRLPTEHVLHVHPPFTEDSLSSRRNEHVYSTLCDPHPAVLPHPDRCATPLDLSAMQPLTGASERCSTTNCLRTARAAKCSRRKCAKCCRLFGIPCGHKDHDKTRQQEEEAHYHATVARQTDTSTRDPFQLACPRPVVPPSASPLMQTSIPPLPASVPADRAFSPVQHPSPQVEDTFPPTPPTTQFPWTSSTTLTNAMTSGTAPSQSTTSQLPRTSQLPQRHLQAPMEPAWKAAYDEAKRKRQARLDLEEQRRSNERAIKHSVRIRFWHQVRCSTHRRL